MHSICYIVPYFGKLPPNFDLWLMGCKNNPTVNWLLLTDDEAPYAYPDNVRVEYISFGGMKARLQSLFDFDIVLNKGWDLCKFKPCYGEAFQDLIQGFDFWGYCDIDLMWGNLRHFYTVGILENYEKIGWQGHSTLYRNTPVVNSRYKTSFDGFIDYRTVFGSDLKADKINVCFDEGSMGEIYRHLGIPFYCATDFAHLRKYSLNFSLEHLPSDEEWKNEAQVFTWEDGCIFRHYIDRDGTVAIEEFAYLHFWCKPMTYAVGNLEENPDLLIVPDKVMKLGGRTVLPPLVKKYSMKNPIRFYAKALWWNRAKLTPERIAFNIEGALKREY